MMAFFFISGLLFNYSSALKKPFPETVKKLLFTMAVPFLFFELLGVVRDLIRFGFELNLFGFLHNTLTLHFNNGILWFIFTLFIAELLFIPLAKAVSSKQILLLITFLMVPGTFFIPETSEPLLYAIRIPRAVFFLATGYTAPALFEKPRWWLAGLCAAVISVLTYFHLNVEFTTTKLRNLPWFFLNSFCGIYFILTLGRLKPGGSWLDQIGKNSIIIYGTHSLYYIVFGFWMGIRDFKGISFWKGSLIFLLVALAEVPTVFLLNRFAPFLVGKKRKKWNSQSSE